MSSKNCTLSIFTAETIQILRAIHKILKKDTESLKFSAIRQVLTTVCKRNEFKPDDDVATRAFEIDFRKGRGK